MFMAAGALAEPQRITATPYCDLSEESLSFQTIIETQYSPTKGATSKIETHMNRYLVWVICSTATGDCKGARVNLKRVDEGRPLGMLDVQTLDYMRLVSVSGKVATLVERIFTYTVDIPKKVVSFRESDTDQDGVGSGPCE
jgi:hypothetical protein